MCRAPPDSAPTLPRFAARSLALGGREKPDFSRTIEPTLKPGVLAMKIFCLALLVALGACTNANHQAEIDAQLRAQDANQCRNYGYTPGSAAFAQCRQNLDQQRISAGEANRAVMLNYMLTHRESLLNTSLRRVVRRASQRQPALANSAAPTASKPR